MRLQMRRVDHDASGGLVFRSPRYDAAYAFSALAAQVVWIAVLFNVLD